jgi:hypothetical protein
VALLPGQQQEEATTVSVPSRQFEGDREQVTAVPVTASLPASRRGITAAAAATTGAPPAVVVTESVTTTTTLPSPSSAVEEEEEEDIDRLVYTSEETNNDTVRIVLSTLPTQPPPPPSRAGPSPAGQEDVLGGHRSAMQAAGIESVGVKCPPRRVRSVSWPWTAAGTTAETACPVGTRGTARWACQLATPAIGHHKKGGLPATAVWEPSGAPDLSECQSGWMGRILADLRKSDAVGTIAADLVQYVAANPLYGGDIGGAVSAMTIIAEKLEYQLAAIPTMEQREAMVVEVGQALVRTASSLLDVDSLAAWTDLPRRGRTLAAFMAALERTGHLLPRAIAADREVSISSQNVCKYLRFAFVAILFIYTPLHHCC